MISVFEPRLQHRNSIYILKCPKVLTLHMILWLIFDSVFYHLYSLYPEILTLHFGIFVCNIGALLTSCRRSSQVSTTRRKAYRAVSNKLLLRAT